MALGLAADAVTHVFLSHHHPDHTVNIALFPNAEVVDFWRRVAENDPPPADYGRDGALIARFYSDDDGSEVDLSDDDRLAELLAERARLKAIEAQGSAAEKERKPIDAGPLGSAHRKYRRRCWTMECSGRTHGRWNRKDPSTMPHEDRHVRGTFANQTELTFQNEDRLI